MYWSFLKINSFWLADTVLCYMLTIVLDIKCKRGLTSPNFASNVKNFFISFHNISLHSVSFYFILSHFIPCLSISTTFNQFLSIQFYYTPFRYISFYLTLFHFILFHSLPFHTIHSISLCMYYSTLWDGQKQKPNEFGQVKKYTDTYSVLLINYT